MAKIGRSIAAIACLFVFVLLFLGTRAGAGAGAGAGGFVEQKRDCLSQSHKFKGKCFSDHNCGSVCNTEGFPRGHCQGFRQRCFCARPC